MHRTVGNNVGLYYKFRLILRSHWRLC